MSGSAVHQLSAVTDGSSWGVGVRRRRRSLPVSGREGKTPTVTTGTVAG